MFDIVDFKAFLVEKADKLRNDAGMSGSWGDGGSSELLRELECFEAGASFERHKHVNSLPSCWKDHLKEFNKQIDPDYQLYLKLKNKFE